jgi:hypothetical protein
MLNFFPQLSHWMMMDAPGSMRLSSSLMNCSHFGHLIFLMGLLFRVSDFGGFDVKKAFVIHTG